MLGIVVKNLASLYFLKEDKLVLEMEGFNIIKARSKLVLYLEPFGYDIHEELNCKRALVYTKNMKSHNRLHLHFMEGAGVI